MHNVFMDINLVGHRPPSRSHTMSRAWKQFEIRDWKLFASIDGAVVKYSRNVIT